MTLNRKAASPALIATLLISSGCFTQKKPTIPVPVAAPQGPATTAPAAPVPAPAETTPSTTIPSTTAPPKPAPAQTAPTPAQPAKPAPTAVTPRLPATPAPSLGVILSADQRKQFETAYQADLRQANAILNGLTGHMLTPSQIDTANRARAFIKQAGQFHDRDLSTAAGLAHSARVLTQDLAGALK